VVYRQTFIVGISSAAEDADAALGRGGSFSFPSSSATAAPPALLLMRNNRSI